MSRHSVAVLYGANATFTNTVMEHVASFGLFSRHVVRYFSVAPYVPAIFSRLPSFDVVVLHYSFFPGLDWRIPRQLAAILARHQGLKILFLQDEYDHTDAARHWIDALGVQCVYTCLPADARAKVYPAERFGRVEFRQTLTGFVPLVTLGLEPPPLHSRPIWIGYRGRSLHPRYGNLGREKWLIGDRMKTLCSRRGIPADIETSEEKRIYGPAWYSFLGNCRATLGSESGSNVLDPDGKLRARIDATLARRPGMGYEEIHARHIGTREGEIRTNQVSPRLFEAVVMRTALILFEGEYSGAVRPWEHYLPLRKDFGNVEDILRRLEDVPSLDAMVGRAYDHIVHSGNYSYRSFIRDFDDYVESRAIPRHFETPPVHTLAVPANAESQPFMQEVPSVPTDVPFKVQWLLPEVRQTRKSSLLRRVLGNS